MPNSFSRFALLLLSAGSVAQAQDVPPAAPIQPSATVAPSTEIAAPSAPVAAPSAEVATPLVEAAPTAAVVVPPPAFPTTPYAGRLPPPRRHAIEPPEPQKHGDAGAPVALGIGGNYRFRDDVGYRRLGSGDHQTELDLFASYDVLQPVTALVVSAGLNYRYGSQGSDVSVATHGIAAELTARYALASWLFPQLRAALGVQTARLEISSDEYGVGMSDKSVSPLGSLGAGFTLRSPARMFETRAGKLSSMSLGLLVEAGYLFAKAASFEASPDGSSEVPQQSISLGKLEQSSPYLRLMAVLRI